MSNEALIENIRNFRIASTSTEASTEWGEGFLAGQHVALDAVVEFMEQLDAEEDEGIVTPIILTDYDEDALVVEFDHKETIEEQYRQGGLWQVMEYVEEHYLTTNVQRQLLISTVMDREKESARQHGAQRQARAAWLKHTSEAGPPIDLTGALEG